MTDEYLEVVLFLICTKLLGHSIVCKKLHNFFSYTLGFKVHLVSGHPGIYRVKYFNVSVFGHLLEKISVIDAMADQTLTLDCFLFTIQTFNKLKYFNFVPDKYTSLMTMFHSTQLSWED